MSNHKTTAIHKLRQCCCNYRDVKSCSIKPCCCNYTSACILYCNSSKNSARLKQYMNIPWSFKCHRDKKFNEHNRYTLIRLPRRHTAR